MKTLLRAHMLPLSFDITDIIDVRWAIAELYRWVPGCTRVPDKEGKQLRKLVVQRRAAEIVSECVKADEDGVEDDYSSSYRAEDDDRNDHHGCRLSFLCKKFPDFAIDLLGGLFEELGHEASKGVAALIKDLVLGKEWQVQYTGTRIFVSKPGKLDEEGKELRKLILGRAVDIVAECVKEDEDNGDDGCRLSALFKKYPDYATHLLGGLFEELGHEASLGVAAVIKDLVFGKQWRQVQHTRTTDFE